MVEASQHPVTDLLDAVHRGVPDARQRLLEAVYHELREMARVQMACEPPGRTLQPTALVNEAYLKLFAGREGHFENRRHFFAAAGRAMRQIRVDYARRRDSLKRNKVGSFKTKANVAAAAVLDEDRTDLVALDEVLKKLEAHDPELSEVVHLRYFAGLGIDETAQLLSVSPRTVDNRWKCAKAWLHRALSPE